MKGSCFRSVFNKTKALIGYEYSRAVKKHGPTFSSLNEGFDALRFEMIEVRDAIDKDDISGRHGVRRETAQVIAVCLKILDGLPQEE
jgi:hypothetical protein